MIYTTNYLYYYQKKKTAIKMNRNKNSQGRDGATVWHWGAIAPPEILKRPTAIYMQ